MRIAVLSDIHGNLPALERVLRDLRRRAPDLVVHLGDLVSGPLWPVETLALLGTLDHHIVRGNHDRWVATLPPEEQTPTNRWVREAIGESARAMLGALPPRLEPVEGVTAVHGTPASDTEYLLEDVVDGRLARATPARLGERLGGLAATLVLCGHSHVQHAARSADGVLVVNPGSVGCPRSVDQRAPAAIEAGSPHARYAVVTSTPRGWEVEAVALVYAWEQVAQRAALNGRRDWGEAFLGGGSAA